MRYKEDNDNRYRVNFMRATEELMDAITVESFISGTVILLLRSSN